jgi:hypothetical protein
MQGCLSVYCEEQRMKTPTPGVIRDSMNERGGKYHLSGESPEGGVGGRSEIGGSRNVCEGEWDGIERGESEGREVKKRDETRTYIGGTWF